jgi:hypothetical protein
MDGTKCRVEKVKKSKSPKKTFKGDGFVHYLDFDHCFMGYTCQNMSNFSLKIWQYVVIQLYLDEKIKLPQP